MSRVLIVADDHPLFRGALREIIFSLSGISKVVEAEDFEAAASALVQYPEVDLMLLDLTMPGTSGLTGLALLRAEHPSIPIAIVSGNEDGTVVSRALDLGASGFIPKSASFQEIKHAIQQLLAGEVYLPKSVAIDTDIDLEIAGLIERIRTFTPQQTRVLLMLGKGLFNRQIASEFGISEATTKAHVSAILEKLGLSNRTQAVIQLSRLEMTNETL